VTLAFTGNLSSIDFDNFAVRYTDVFSQQLGIDGWNGFGTPVPAVPEPTGAALFGGGLLIAFWVRRMRRS
jgi:hypothetical protein